jgi:cytochrome c1
MHPLLEMLTVPVNAALMASSPGCHVPTLISIPAGGVGGCEESAADGVVASESAPASSPSSPSSPHPVSNASKATPARALAGKESRRFRRVVVRAVVRDSWASRFTHPRNQPPVTVRVTPDHSAVA